jgi:hypothetical protein
VESPSLETVPPDDAVVEVIEGLNEAVGGNVGMIVSLQTLLPFASLNQMFSSKPLVMPTGLELLDGLVYAVNGAVAQA